MAPCPAAAWFAAACAIVPLESVRYRYNMRASIVRKWLAAYDEYAIQNGVFVKIAERKRAQASDKGTQLWLRLKTEKVLTEEEALKAWSRRTWKTYRLLLTKLQWVRRLPDGSVEWIGPDDATFTEFHQYRTKRSE